MELLLADLEVHPTSVNAGDSISVSFTVSNVGGMDSERITSQIYFSPTSIPREYFYIEEGIPAGEEVLVGPVEIQLANDLPRGEYSIDVRAETRSQVEIEGSIIKTIFSNHLEASIYVHSEYFLDLEILPIDASTSIAPVGGVFRATAEWLNNGNVEPEYFPDVEFRLSQDSAIESTDPWCGGGPNVWIPQDTVPGDYYFGACVHVWHEADSDLSNNCTSIPLQVVSAEGVPDLAPLGSNLEGRIPPRPGESMTLSFEIQNPEEFDSDPFSISVILIQEEGIEFPIDTFRYPGISAGATLVTAPVGFQIPEEAAPGYSRKLAFCIDPANEILETDERNNCWSRSITIDGFRDVELVSLQIRNPVVEIGGSVSADFVVRNNDYELPSDIDNAAFLSLDSTITAEDPMPVYRTYTFNPYRPEIPEKSSVTGFQLPFYVTPGSYYLGMCVDWSDSVEETDETNNCLVAPFTVVAPAAGSFPAEIEVQGFFTDVYWGKPGEMIHAFLGIKNHGDFDTGVLDVFFESPMEESLFRDSFDVEGLPAGKSRLLGPLPIQVPTYYSLDDDTHHWFRGYVGNSDIGYSESGTTFFVRMTPPDIDLRPGFSAEFNPLFPSQLSVAVTKDLISGSLPIGVRNEVRWSLDPVPTPGDPVLARFTADPYRSSTRLTVDLPEGFSEVDQYLTLCVDSTDIIQETDESNNCLTDRVTFKSIREENWDCGIEDFSIVPSIAYPGDEITASLTARMCGEEGSTGVLEASVDLSVDPINEGQTDQLNDDELLTKIVARIPLNESHTSNINLKLPDNLASGTYYALACLDHVNFDYLLRCASFTVRIVSLKTHDLSIADITLDPNRGGAGQTVDLTFTASNDGNSGTEKFNNSVLWSTERRASTEDLVLRNIRWGSVNGFDSERAGPIPVQIPPDARPGTYFVAVCADTYSHLHSSVAETDETNNCSYAPFVVTDSESDHEAPASIEIQGIASDITRGNPGDTVSLYWGIKNSGPFDSGELQISIDLAYNYFTGDSDSVQLGTMIRPGIQPEVSHIYGPIPLHIPESARNGQAFIIVSVNTPYQGKTYSAALPFVIGSPPGIDLLPEIQLPEETDKRAALKVNLAAVNNSSVELNTTTQVSVLWSPDPMFASYNHVLANSTAGFMGAGGNYVDTITVMLPENVPLGTNYITVCVDSTNKVKETNEANNCKTGTVEVVSSVYSSQSLKPVNLSLDRSIVSPEDIISASFSIEDGEQEITQGWTLYGYFRWSSDETIDDRDYILREIVLNDSSNRLAGNFSFPVQVPADLMSGTYYLGVCTQLHSPTSENDWRYHCVSAPVSVRSQKTNELKIDRLGISTNRGYPGDRIWLSFRAVNEGNSVTPGFTNSVRWSESEEVKENDVELRSVMWGGLNADESFFFGPFAVTIPENSKPGTYYISVCADSQPGFENRVTESSKEDNCSSAPFTVIGGPRNSYGNSNILQW